MRLYDFFVFLVFSLVILWGVADCVNKLGEINRKIDGVIKNQEILIECHIFNRCSNGLPEFMKEK